VLFVAGELMGHGRWYYAISEIEFGRGNLTSPAAQLHRAVLAPKTSYETYGFTPHTVFMNGIVYYRNKWWMYYGAGDSVIALATAR
jgi:beta-1,2-mannosidase